MKVLFIGGTGLISSACSPLVLEKGMELTLFNRGKTTRPVPSGARLIQGDIRDLDNARSLLGREEFDVIVDWIAYNPGQVEADIQLFRGRTDQYVFISSASAYQTPPVRLPVTESTPLENPYWEYSREKIACEVRLVQEYHSAEFPITIVRPAHTYDQRTLPFRGRWTVVDRMRRGQKVVVHGDGTSLWGLLHHTDFAKAFVSLLGNPRAVGEAFHITSDELLNWNQIYETVAQAAGADAPKLVHIPSEVIDRFDPTIGASLLGDKSVSMVYDNSKIKQIASGWSASIPFAQGAREIIAWFDEDPARKVIDKSANALFDRLIELQEAVRP